MTRARRRRRGLALLDALLAAAAMASMLLFAGQAVGTMVDRAALAAEARAVAALADAARLWVEDDTARAPAAGPPVEIDPADLEAAGLRGPGALRRTPGRRRAMAVFLLRDAGDRVLVFARARGGTVPPGTPGAVDGVARVGTVPEGGSDLRGPDVSYDFTALNLASPGFAMPGDLFAMGHVLLTARCAAYLHRAPVAGCPDATRMQAPLDMGGQDITGAGTVAAARLETPWVDGGGPGAVAVTGRLDVAGPLTVEGAAVVEGSLTVNGATALTDTLAVTGRLTAGDITATGTVAGSGLTFRGRLSVAGDAVFGAADGGNVIAARVVATTVAANEGTFTDLAVDDLTVGSCTGC